MKSKTWIIAKEIRLVSIQKEIIITQRMKIIHVE